MSGGDDQNGVLGVSGAHCSHSTCSIYGQAGFPYSYQTSGAFEGYAAELGTPFDLVTSGPPQVGDVLVFSGHLAIYGGNGMIYTTHGSSIDYSAPKDIYGTDNPAYFGPYKDYRYELPGAGK
jgi:hypothetical protein